MLLAIVIPYYKIAFFAETLHSLSIQTDKRFKVYIGNDASPEDPSDLLEQYRGAFDFEYYKFDNNLGGTSLVQQWNRCIKLTNREEWISIIGDDDTVSPNYVLEFYNYFQNFSSKCDVIRFAVQKITADGSFFGKLNTNPELENSKIILFDTKRSSLSEYVFNRNKLQETHFKNFKLAWWSDVLVVLEVSNFGNIFSINKAQANVRISELSISGSSAFLLDKQLATFSFYKYLIVEKRKEFSDRELLELERRIANCYFDNKKNVLLFIKICLIHLRNLNFYGLLLFIQNSKSKMISVLKQ